MLSKILEVLVDAQEPLCAETLALKLQKDIDVVVAMLQELVLLGKVHIEIGQSTCETCQLKSLCGLPIQSTTRYQISHTGE